MLEDDEAHSLGGFLFGTALIGIATFLVSWVVLGVVIQAGTKLVDASAYAGKSFDTAAVPSAILGMTISAVYFWKNAKLHARELGDQVIGVLIAVVVLAVIIWAFR